LMSSDHIRLIERADEAVSEAMAALAAAQRHAESDRVSRCITALRQVQTELGRILQADDA
jgi:hypothetical protein